MLVVLRSAGASLLRAHFCDAVTGEHLMTGVTREAPRPRAWTPFAAPWSGVRIGLVPLLFANDDLPDLTPPTTAQIMLSEIARIGFEGTQFSRVLPRGAALREVLESHDVRVAEVYAALPCAQDGPPREALAIGRAKIQESIDSDADVLILSYHLSPGRTERAGRAHQRGTPVLSGDGWKAATAVLHQLAREAQESGRLAVYHPHVGTYVETPGEIDHLLEITDPAILQLCLDLGHYTLAGGDAIEGLRRYSARVRHIHFKDVAQDVMDQVRTDSRIDFFSALRSRIFTELGFGVLDVAGIIDQLIDMNYKGWIMCEQDTSWWPAAESAAISRRVLDFALRQAENRRQPGRR